MTLPSNLDLFKGSIVGRDEPAEHPVVLALQAADREVARHGVCRSAFY